MSTRVGYQMRPLIYTKRYYAVRSVFRTLATGFVVAMVSGFFALMVVLFSVLATVHR